MAMTKRKLISKSASKPIRKTMVEKRIQAQKTKKNKSKTKAKNKAYYRKNKTEILKRAKKRRDRAAKGDVRTTRRKASL